ncbi:hypothetical protein, partial [Vibrio diazotrophicus]|uniref:hypothetical protein n=1 Tax=Vibrio diazotrophicus TaxID=685 RepID=UPI00142DB335
IVKDLPTAYQLLEGLSCPDLTQITDDTFLQLCEFLDNKQVSYDFLNAITKFYEYCDCLFTSKRLGNAQEAGLQQQISNQKIVIADLKQSVEEAEQEDNEQLAQIFKSDLMQARSSLGDLKKKLKDLTSNSLADNQLDEFASMYGKHYSTVLLWVNSVSKYHHIPSTECWQMEYVEFLKLSNMQQLSNNMEYAQHMKAKAQAEREAAQANKGKQPPHQNRF